MCLKIENSENYYILFNDLRLISDTGEDQLMECDLKIKVEEIEVNTTVSFMNSHLINYHSELVKIYQKMVGVLVFHDIDSRLEISLSCCNETGNIFIEGCINGKLYCTKFEFDFSIDQSYLPRIIDQLKIVI